MRGLTGNVELVELAIGVLIVDETEAIK